MNRLFVASGLAVVLVLASGCSGDSESSAESRGTSTSTRVAVATSTSAPVTGLEESSATSSGTRATTTARSASPAVTPSATSRTASATKASATATTAAEPARRDAKTRKCYEAGSGRYYRCTKAQYKKNLKEMKEQDVPMPGDSVDDPDGTTYRTCVDRKGYAYECTEAQYSAQSGGPVVDPPSRAECQRPTTGSMHDACVAAYSRSQTGVDPRLPTYAVPPQTCSSWSRGEITLTRKQQQYCRDNAA